MSDRRFLAFAIGTSATQVALIFKLGAVLAALLS